VFTTEAHKLFIKDNWYSGITLQEWFFKPKEAGAVKTGTTEMWNIPAITIPTRTVWLLIKAQT